MFIIGEAVIDDAVSQASFCCDLERCKGACCCIEGGRGAPLEDDEVLEIEKAFPFVKPFLSEKSIRTIETSGLYEGKPGNFATNCVDQKECVFVYFDRGIAKCGFERAYDEGKTDWRKPISCHLFPIRIREIEFDMVHYETIEECAAGRELGNVLEIPLTGFLKEPLIRKYGEAWYNEFLDHCKEKAHCAEKRQ